MLSSLALIPERGQTLVKNVIYVSLSELSSSV